MKHYTGDVIPAFSWELRAQIRCTGTFSVQKNFLSFQEVVACSGYMIEKFGVHPKLVCLLMKIESLNKNNHNAFMTLIQVA